MNVHMQMAEAVRQVCSTAALQAYDDAGVSGLCHEGRWEYAVDANAGAAAPPADRSAAPRRRTRGGRRPRVVGDESRDPRRRRMQGWRGQPPWPPEPRLGSAGGSQHVSGAAWLWPGGKGPYRAPASR